MLALFDTSDMLGQPFKKGGRDLLTGIDCFGVLMECQRRIGNPIADFRSPEFHHEMAAALNENKKSWTEHWTRFDQDLVPLSICQPGRALQIAIKGTACHVGFVHKPGWFIHAWEDTAGVTIERINFWKQRIVGVYEFNGNGDC